MRDSSLSVTFRSGLGSLANAKSLFASSRCASSNEGHCGVFDFDRVQEC
jgi:hypothetical protein